MKWLLLSTLSALAACALSGCRREPSPPVAVVDARDKAGAPAAAAPPAATAPAPTTVQVGGPPQHPPFCEVEISGDLEPIPGVEWPKAGPSKIPLGVYAAEGDCLAKDARILGRVPISAPPHFFIEVFSHWGVDVTVCAASDSAPGQTTRLYGKATGTRHAETAGEVVFTGLKIRMEKGPPHVFPAPIKNVFLDLQKK